MKPFGGPELRYKLVPDWERLPEGYSHPDVAGVAADREGNVHLFCRGDHPVMTYDRSGRFLDSWGQGLFTLRTHGMFLDDRQRLLLVDDGAHSVRRYSIGGKLLDTIGPAGQPTDTGYDGSDLDSVVRGAGPYNRPTKAAVAPNGDIYVSDGYANARVHRFTEAGEHLASWGEPGTGPGEFHVPHCIWVRDDGLVFVGDRHNDRIQIFSPTGEFVSEWLDVQRPQDIFMDPDGLVYVAELPWLVGMSSNRRGPITEFEPGRVSVYDRDGNVLGRWSDPDGTQPGYCVAPHGIAVDDEGSIYLAEVTKTFGIGNGLAGADCHTFQKFARV